MTLIVGLNCGDHLLLSADSGITDEAGALDEFPKLEFGGGFAWGFGGLEDSGLRFHEWMRNERPRFGQLGSWDLVVHEIEAFAHRVNSERLAGIVGRDMYWNDLFHPVVAGFVGDKGMVYMRDFNAGPIRLTGKYPRVLASLGVNESVSGLYRSLKSRDRWAHDQSSLEELMELAIAASRPPMQLLRPIRTIRVNRDMTSIDVSGAAFRARFPELFLRS